MEIKIHQNGIVLGKEDEVYLESKFENLLNFDKMLKEDLVKIDVCCAELKGKSPSGHIELEVTIHVPGAVLRAEVYAVSVHEAADLVFEKLKRQLERYKSKHERRDNGGKWIPSSTLQNIAAIESEDLIKRRKKMHELPEMHEDEAIHQMELIDHDFFVYRDADSRGINVLYKRHKDGFGLLEFEA